MHISFVSAVIFSETMQIRIWISHQPYIWDKAEIHLFHEIRGLIHEAGLQPNPNWKSHKGALLGAVKIFLIAKF